MDYQNATIIRWAYAASIIQMHHHQFHPPPPPHHHHVHQHKRRRKKFMKSTEGGKSNSLSSHALDLQPVSLFLGLAGFCP